MSKPSISLVRLATQPSRPVRRLNEAGTAWRIETYLGRHTVRFPARSTQTRPPRKETAP